MAEETWRIVVRNCGLGSSYEIFPFESRGVFVAIGLDCEHLRSRRCAFLAGRDVHDRGNDFLDLVA